MIPRPLGILLLLGSFLTRTGGTTPEQAPDPRIADLARAGKLRAALFLPQYTPDSNGAVGRVGAVGSVLVELANQLAKPLGIDVIVEGYPTPPSVVACLRQRTCDIALMGPDESREGDLDLSHPVVEIDYTYLVAPGSSIQHAPDVDRPGVRVAGVRDHASTLTISRLLEEATMVTAETPDATFELLRSGKADVLVSVRTALERICAPKLPGRVCSRKTTASTRWRSRCQKDRLNAWPT